MPASMVTDLVSETPWVFLDLRIPDCGHGFGERDREMSHWARRRHSFPGSPSVGSNRKEVR
jgi:hypothetical protein